MKGGREGERRERRSITVPRVSRSPYLIWRSTVLGFCQLDTNVDIPGKREPQLTNHLHQIGL